MKNLRNEFVKLLEKNGISYEIEDAEEILCVHVLLKGKKLKELIISVYFAQQCVLFRVFIAKIKPFYRKSLLETLNRIHGETASINMYIDKKDRLTVTLFWRPEVMSDFAVNCFYKVQEIEKTIDNYFTELKKYIT